MSPDPGGRVSLPPWPAEDPAHGGVRLRAFRDDDIFMVLTLSRDRAACIISTLPFTTDKAGGQQWITQQQRRHLLGMGYSFCIADAATDKPAGQVGIWTAPLSQGYVTIGYAVAPQFRGRGLAGDALVAATEFAWTIPGTQRAELYIEPSNPASFRTGEKAGYQRQELIPEHSFIDGRHRDMYRYTMDRPPGR